MPDAAPQSLLSFFMASLGPIYCVLLPLAAILSLLFSILLIARGRGPLVSAALILVAFTPILIGCFASLTGLLDALRVVAMSGTTPKPATLAMGYSTALVSLVVGILCAVPSLAIGTLGSITRALTARQPTANETP